MCVVVCIPRVKLDIPLPLDNKASGIFYVLAGSVNKE